MKRIIYQPRPVLWLLLLVVFTSQASGQNLDSLERLLPTLEGEKKLSVLGDLAFMYCFSNTDKALYFGNQELQLATEIGDSGMIALAWNDLASAYVSRGEFEKSLELNYKALGTRVRLGDSLKVASSLSKIGQAYAELGQLDRALPPFIRAANIFEAENKPSQLSLLLNNIGTVLHRQGNKPRAIEYFEKAIDVAAANNDAGGTIGPKSNIGMIYFEDGEFLKSKYLMLELVRLINETGIRDNLPTITMNVGACYLESAEFDSALYYFKSADTLLEAKGDKKSLSMVKVDLGICYAKMKEFALSEQYLAVGKKYAEETGSYVQLKHVYEGYRDLEVARGNFELALDYLNKSLEYERLYHNEEINDKLAEAEVRYQTEKKEKDLALREKELAASRLRGRNLQLVILLLTGGLLLVSTSIVLVIRRQKLRRERLQQKAILALQEERLRISRDLHDNIGAELTLITSSLEMQAFKAAAEQKQELENIGSYSRNAMAQLRETIWAIRSETISVESLSLRLMDYAAKLGKPKGIATRVVATGDVQKPLSPTQTIHLYRLCQEAINNAVKYAQCKSLIIKLEATKTSLDVHVVDDGVGFDVTANSDGYGLKNMKARAEEMGGSFSVQSQAQVGTTIDLHFPC